MRKKQLWLIALGSVLALAGILVTTSFFYTENHAWYWKSAYVLCIFAIFSIVSGSFLAGYNLKVIRSKWVVGIGIFWLVACVAAGVCSIFMAAFFLSYFKGADYWGWQYHGDYMGGGFHILSLEIASLTGLIGGFLTGLGLGRRGKTPDASGGL